MQKTINAVYENGVIKPLQRIHFKGHEKLSIAISRKASKPAKAKNPDLAMIGVFESGAGDLSGKHDEYLYGKKRNK